MVQTTGSDHEMRRAPAGATEWSSRDFRSPGRGSDSIFAMNRWFAPPANVQCPFGTTPLLQPWNAALLSNTNSREEMGSRRFEVEDFAKQILLIQATLDEIRAA